MKLFARSKNLIETVAPVITLNRLMGLRVFEYPRGRPRPILSLIYLLFLYCLCYFGSNYLQEGFYSNLHLLKLEYFLNEISENIVIYLIFVELLLGWWYTKKFEACYKKIFKIDETLRQLGSAVNYDKMYFIIIGVMFVLFLFNLSTCIALFIVMWVQTDVLYTTIINSVTFFYVLTVTSIIIFEFYILVKCLQIRFELINKLLHESLSALSGKEIKLGFFEIKDYAKIMDVERQKCLPPINILSHWCRQKQGEPRNRSQRHNFVMTDDQKHIHLLHVITQVHLELCKVSKTICIIFGVQTACEIGIGIAFLTGVLYSLYIRYFVQQHKVTNILMQQTVVTIMPSILDVLKITFLSRVCKDTADEGNKTLEIIRSIYGCDTESNIQEEIQQFSFQILQCPVRFSVYGICLDNQVLTMMLKVVITYLIIMIQVSNSLESNKTIQSP